MLSEACASVCVDELSLQPDHDFVVKVVQFQELLDVRHRCDAPTTSFNRICTAENESGKRLYASFVSKQTCMLR